MKSRLDLPNYLNEQKLLGIGVEIGVLKGTFSEYILNKWNGNKLYSIDAWRTFSGRIDCNNKKPPEHLENLTIAFKKLYNFGERSCIIKELSSDAANLFKDESLDFVYIDAGHDYGSVMQDLNVWYPKVKKNGLFCGDDYIDGVFMYNDDESTITSFQVKQAVDEFANKLNYSVNTTNSEDDSLPQWWFHK